MNGMKIGIRQRQKKKTETQINKEPTYTREQNAIVISKLVFNQHVMV